MAIYSSAALSPGKGFWKGPYSQLSIVAGSVALSFTTTATLAPAPDDKVAAKATLYNTSTGIPYWTIYIQPMIVSG
jgi:hypothetical protein